MHDIQYWLVYNGMLRVLACLIETVFRFERPMLKCHGCNGKPWCSACSSPLWHAWTYVLLLPWFEVPVGHDDFDRRIQEINVCFGHMQQLTLCRPRRASHGVDLYIPF